MFFSQRNSHRRGNRKQWFSRRPFRPFLELLEDRITPTGPNFNPTVTVSNVAQLQNAIMQANDNMSGTYVIGLNPGTYQLTTQLKLTNPTAGTTIVLEQTPGTSGSVILNGQSQTRVLEVTGNTTTAIIGNVTIEHGKATDDPTGTVNAAGGGLVNQSGNVMLSYVNFTSNSAAAAAGGDADGGGIFTLSGALSLDTVALKNNQATGGAGTTAAGAGAAFGGAIGEKNTTVIVTNVPFAPGQAPQTLQTTFNPSALTAPLLTVTGNTALGGRGGDGTAAAINATNGGQGIGGGLQMSGGSVNIAVASFSGNTAQGGDGGNGTNGAATAGGTGGNGGSSFGGAVEVTSTAAGNAVLLVQKSLFTGNSALGGIGGKGGNATAAAAAGGNGGNGGDGIGGAFEVFSAATAPPQFTMSNSTVVQNTANAGHGGNGGNGNGAAGGNGGNGGNAFGGGMDVRTTTTMTSQLLNDTIALNTIDSQTSNGSPGNGGAGGTGGTQGTATGGGINSDGSAVFTNGMVAENTLVNGNQTNGGPDVAGKIGTSTTFSYFGNPNGANLLTDPALFNTATQTPLGNNYYGGFKDAGGTLVPGGASVGLASSLASTLPTQILPLQAGSFLVGLGTGGNAASSLDQVGVSRAASPDLGAAEFNKAASSVSITGSLSGSPLNFSTSSQPVTVSAAVSINGTLVTGGTVVFALLEPNGSTLLPGSITQSQNVNKQGSTGNVTLTVPANAPPGTYTLQATYTDANGNSYPAQAISTATLKINAIPATVGTVTVSPSSISANTASSVTVSTTVTSSGGTINEGTVTFELFNGSTPVNDSNGNPVEVTSGTLANGATGNVKWNLPALATGNYTVQATYADPNGSFAASQPGSGSLTVAQSATVGTVTVSPSSISANTASSVTVSTTVTSSGGTINEGTVTFELFNGSTPVNDSNGNPIEVTSPTLTNGATGNVNWNLPALAVGSYNVQATYTDPSGGFVASQPGSAALTVAQSSTSTSKIGVFSNGSWYLDTDGNGSWDPPADSFISSFGFQGAIPVVGNWGPNHSTDIGIYYNGAWYLNTDGTGVWKGNGNGGVVYNFGFAGATPVVGNWGPNGSTGIGIYYNGAWYINTDGTGVWNGNGNGGVQYNFGFAGATPVVGNWGPHSAAGIGIFYNGAWYVNTDGTGVWNGNGNGGVQYNFGFAGATPVAGNWGPHGAADIGVFYNGTWYVNTDGTGVWTGVGFGNAQYNFGFAGANPVTGNWPTSPPLVATPHVLLTAQQGNGTASSDTAAPPAAGQSAEELPAAASLPATTSTPTPAPAPSSLVDAALALFFDGVQLMYHQMGGNTPFGTAFIGNAQGIADVEASIALNSPYLGQLAPLLVLAGESWATDSLLAEQAG